MIGGSDRTLNPVMALALLLWSFTMIALGEPLWPLIIAVPLAAYSKLLFTLLPAYAWLSIPPLLVLLVLYGLEAALETTFRVVLVAFIFTASIGLVNPLDYAALASTLKLPPAAGLTIPLVFKLTLYMRYTVLEAIAALTGRGFKGLKLYTKLPIPLTIHVITSSTMLAEALHQKKISKPPWKPKFTPLDVAVAAYILAATIITLIF
ncbi:MAG: hypothetical protein P3X22_001105 [Thermoprotei archaeon]|nr:hypothetical protein [Thermoprotei archaeon]